MAEKQKNKFPSEVIDLPSKGKLYPKDSPLASGKVEIKYMTAREEDILTSQNLITKGIVVERLLNSLIVNPDVNSSDLLIGDKNAIMVAARILAYGPDYTVEVIHPTTNEKLQHTFNLADCPFKDISEDVEGNEFEIELPISKKIVKFRLLTGKEEKLIENEVKSKQKIGLQVAPTLTTRLKYSITSVDGETDKPIINNFVENMLSKDSWTLRNRILEVSPDIELKQEVELGGEMVEVDIPLTIEFFWPSTVT